MAEVKIVDVETPQLDGEITVTTYSVDGSVSDSYKVTNHRVSVKDDKLPLFLASVEGSKVAGSPSVAPKEGTK